jgi:hypothetical protein
MNAHFSESDNTVPRPHQSRLPVFALGIVVSAVAIYAIVQAPTTWRSLERFKAEQIQQEDWTYCEQFRMPPRSESFAACAARLMEVRRRHGDRLAAEAAGLL